MPGLRQTRQGLDEVSIYDGDEVIEIEESDLGTDIGFDDDDDPDFEKCDFEVDYWYVDEGEISRIDYDPNRVCCAFEIELPQNEKFDIHNARLLRTELLVPNEDGDEVEVYIGLLYNGKQYAMDIEF